MFKYIEKGINIVRREMEYIKKNPWECASGEEKKLFEMKNSLEEIKNRFHTTKKKTNEFEDTATESIQNKAENKDFKTWTKLQWPLR